MENEAEASDPFILVHLLAPAKQNAIYYISQTRQSSPTTCEEQEDTTAAFLPAAAAEPRSMPQAPL